MGRPKKNLEADAIEQEVLGGSSVAVQEAPKVNKVVEEQEYSLNVIKDYDNVDIFYLPSPDPKYRYHWLRDNKDTLSLATGNLLHFHQGWQLVKGEHATRIGIEAKFLSEDGYVRRGDLILAFMPADLYKEKQAKEQEKANAPVKEIDRLLKEGNPSEGRLHPSMKGIQTEEQLKGNWKEK